MSECDRLTREMLRTTRGLIRAGRDPLDLVIEHSALADNLRQMESTPHSIFTSGDLSARACAHERVAAYLDRRYLAPQRSRRARVG